MANQREKPLVVSLCGPAGAGKSTLALAIVARFGSELATRVPADYFILPGATRSASGAAAPYQYDWPLLAELLRKPVGTTVRTPEFDFTTFSRAPGADSRPFVIRPVMIVDAMYPFPDADFLVAMTATAATRLKRVEDRDERWKSRVAARWKSLEAARAWLEQSGMAPDLQLDGEHPPDANAELVVNLIKSVLRMDRDS